MATAPPKVTPYTPEARLPDITDQDFKRLPPALQAALADNGVRATNIERDRRLEKDQPYTQAGASNLALEAVMPNMRDETQGVHISDPDDASRASALVYNKGNGINQPTRAHEMEHVLARQGLGSASRLNSTWDKTVGNDGAKRGDIVKRLIEHAHYLEKAWGLAPEDVAAGYFSKTVLKRGDQHNFLYEQLATLSALEQARNKRLVDDPYVRKNILTTPAERETYDALTGLRQTRLDARDLPPHTRQPERAPVTAKPGVVEGIKKALGFSRGGTIERTTDRR